MSRSCKSTVTGHTFATAFFGGVSRGKVIQLHMTSEELELFVGRSVLDEASGVVETLEDWLRGECANASMILFDNGTAEPKVSSIPVATI